MEVDHDLVIVDEFDALAIELKVSPKPSWGAGSSTSSIAPPSRSSGDRDAEKARLKLKQQLLGLRHKLGKYPAKLHARKIAQELGVQTGLIYLLGQTDILYEDSDASIEFRQRRYFCADFANCAVTYDIARDNLVLWIPHVQPKDVLWTGFIPSAEDCKRASDVDDVRPLSSGLDRYLHTTLRPGGTLYLVHGDQAPRLEPTKGVLHIDARRLRPAMDAARSVKSDYEVAMIRRAAAVSGAAHRAVLARLRRLSNEREVEAIFRGFCLAQGARHQAYPPIAAAGVHASTLHYTQNDGALQPNSSGDNGAKPAGQVLVLDAGCEWDCYGSDITRTVPVTGTFTPEAAAVYAAVQKMQEACLVLARPGAGFRTLQRTASRVAAAELLRLGLLRGASVDALCESGVVAAFFPHGLGHHLGLDTHDVSRPLAPSGASADAAAASSNGRRRRGARREHVSAETLAALFREEKQQQQAVAQGAADGGDQPFVRNMVITVEPGLYFCREYIQAEHLANPARASYIDTAVLERYYPVGGVRIEDDVLITDAGCDILSLGAPKGEEAIRIINGL